MSDYIYCGGTYDCFHAGHVFFLQAAAQHGRVLVSLNTDEFAASYKRAPIMSLRERMVVVKSCRYVSAVTVNVGGRDSRPAIVRWKPRYIAHGDDWKGVSLMKQLGINKQFLHEHGIEMLELPYTRSVSTSEIIERCSK